jgi:hypothetical protein
VVTKQITYGLPGGGSNGHLSGAESGNQTGAGSGVGEDDDARDCCRAAGGAAREGLDAHLAAKVMVKSQIGSPMLKLRVPLVLARPTRRGSTSG